MSDAENGQSQAEMRLEVEGKIRYPNVAVVAGRIPDDVRALRDAVVLFEVLSDDTAATDRLEKRAEYARVPGIRRYVLLEKAGWWRPCSDPANRAGSRPS